MKFKNKIYILILTTILSCNIAFCAVESIFQHPQTSKYISQNVPVLKDISCNFTQEKQIGDAILKSGGKFKFIQKQGVIFETEYPIKTITSYTSSENKHINNIINAISNKNYSYLDKNFNLFYMKNNNIWTIGLTPKKNTVASKQLKNIIITGQTNINSIRIKTVKNGTTTIRFTCKTN